MKRTKKMLCVGVAFFAGVLLRSASVMAGAKVYVGGKCNHTQHLSLDAADHSAWDTLLRKYVNDRGLVDYAGWKQNAADMRALDVSPILKWFADDFGADQFNQLQNIRPYVPTQTQGTLASGTTRVRYLGYDWSLNDQKRAGR